MYEYETSKSELSVKNKINEVRSIAKANNLKIVFRDKKVFDGDFTFFVYNSEGGRFLIALSGLWKTDHEELTFDSCYDFIKGWIKHYINIKNESNNK